MAQVTNNMPIEEIYKNMNTFNDAMDDIIV